MPPRPSETSTRIVVVPGSAGAVQRATASSASEKPPRGALHAYVSGSPSGSEATASSRTSPPRDTVHGAHEAVTTGRSFTSVTSTTTGTASSAPKSSRTRTVSSNRFGSVSKSSPGPTYHTVPSRKPTSKRFESPSTIPYFSSSPSGSVATTRPSSTGRCRPSRCSGSSKR